MKKTMKFFCIFILICLVFCMVSCSKNTATKHNYKEISLASLKEDLQGLVQNGRASATVSIGYNGQVVFQEGYGVTKKYSNFVSQNGDTIWTLPNDYTKNRYIELSDNELSPIIANNSEKDTLYDLASVTKVMSTTLALQYLQYHKKYNFSVDDKVSKWIEVYKDESTSKNVVTNYRGKDNTTIKQVLTHTAGQFPDPCYFDDVYLKSEQAKMILVINQQVKVR